MDVFILVLYYVTIVERCIANSKHLQNLKRLKCLCVTLHVLLLCLYVHVSMCLNTYESVFMCKWECALIQGCQMQENWEFVVYVQVRVCSNTGLPDAGKLGRCMSNPYCPFTFYFHISLLFTSSTPFFPTSPISSRISEFLETKFSYILVDVFRSVHTSVRDT